MPELFNRWDWPRLTELVILLAAVLAPQFLLAAEVDGDEFAKATAGVALAGVVVAAYKVWRGTANAVTKARKNRDNS